MRSDMRLDKYLKLTRIVKRREVAKVLIEEGSIKANNKVVKPSYEVKIGDIVNLKLGKREIIIKIKDIKEVVGKKNVDTLYEII